MQTRAVQCGIHRSKHILTQAQKVKCSNRIGSDTHGFGTGGNPSVARLAVETSKHEIGECLSGANLIFLVAGLGSGTGTGSTPEIAKLAKEAGALVIAVVTKPFTREGKRRMDIAEQGYRHCCHWLTA